MRRFERYVAIGDSTTEGLEDPDGQGGYRGWANRFAEHLAREVGPIHYANLAVRGRQAGEVREEQLSRALAMNPDVATVVAGVNDLLRPRFELDEVAGHVAAMIAALRAQGATVLTFTMPDMVQVNPLTRIIRGRLDALNERLRQTCAQTGALLLDLAAQSDVAGDPRLWHLDRLHANSLGHERIGLGLAWRLGLPLERRWNEPLPPRPQLKTTERLREEAAWARDYLGPWLARHARGESSGDGRQPKRPALEPFSSQ
jgi:lysophospholipase L1-like esterase